MMRFLVAAALAGSPGWTAAPQRPLPVPWRQVLAQDRTWYATREARAIAESVMRHQRASGGWPKDVDMTVPPSSTEPDATIDNGATTTQILFLARVARGQTGVKPGSDRGQTGVKPGSDPGQTTYAESARRGIDYLLAAQFPNGGWPQVFPLRDDYSRRITFNDNAMINVLTLLQDVADARDPFAFVDADRRSRAALAVTTGTALILKAQIVVHGTLTAWCAQHDEVTLAPRGARAYEHASLSGAETVGIVRFLMRQPRTPEIVRSVDAAVAWLKAVQLSDGRWARFYEIGTNRPIFSGRDGIVRYDIARIEQERRDGYAWYGTWAQKLVEAEYPRWKER